MYHKVNSQAYSLWHNKSQNILAECEHFLSVYCHWLCLLTFVDACPCVSVCVCTVYEWPELFPHDSPEIRVITVWQLCNYADREWVIRLQHGKCRQRQPLWGFTVRETAFYVLLTSSLLSMATGGVMMFGLFWLKYPSCKNELKTRKKSNDKL